MDQVTVECVEPAVNRGAEAHRILHHGVEDGLCVGLRPD
jgi:hypothetical protein